MWCNKKLFEEDQTERKIKCLVVKRERMVIHVGKTLKR